MHPDESLHGAGFVARLSGSTAEFLTIWNIMMAGETPFCIEDGQLCLQFKPILPGWLFDDKGKLSFRFLGHCWVTYHNPYRQNTYEGTISINKVILQTQSEPEIEIENSLITAPLAEMVRTGKIEQIDIYFG